MFLLSCSVLVFLRATRKKSGVLLSRVCSIRFFRSFFVQQFVHKVVSTLKTEEPSMACVNVYKLLRRELKECCYSLLKMIMVINARVCVYSSAISALFLPLSFARFSLLMHLMRYEYSYFLLLLLLLRIYTLTQHLLQSPTHVPSQSIVLPNACGTRMTYFANAGVPRFMKKFSRCAPPPVSSRRLCPSLIFPEVYRQ